jgi:hypothetical protein
VECDEDWLDNETCDAACNTEEFNWDGEDCLFLESDSCSEGCWKSMIGDNVCNPDCETLDCSYDDGDCDACSAGCPETWKGDGWCDVTCYNVDCDYECAYDYADCGCTEECPASKLGNGVCDYKCFNEQCMYDLDDCGY